MRCWQSLTGTSGRLAAVALLFCGVGCTETMTKMSPSNLWHNMQPHRLRKLNSGPGMSSDVYYSVSDRVPQDDPFAEQDAEQRSGNGRE